MRLVAPRPALAPFVRVFMIVEVHEETTHLRLPELGLVLGVRDRGEASVLHDSAASRLPDEMIAGMTIKARLMRTGAGGRIILALFRPGGASAFFGEPLHELFGRTVTLHDVAARADVERLRVRVAEARDDAARVVAVETMLLARLGTAAVDPAVREAVRLLEECRGGLRIRELARHLGMSQDPLEKRFRRAVGATPKQLASLLRVRSAIAAWTPGTSLAAIAQQAGYFDQAHFSRELRAVTGESPARFLRSGIRR